MHRRKNQSIHPFHFLRSWIYMNYFLIKKNICMQNVSFITLIANASLFRNKIFLRTNRSFYERNSCYLVKLKIYIHVHVCLFTSQQFQCNSRVLHYFYWIQTFYLLLFGRSPCYVIYLLHVWCIKQTAFCYLKRKTKSVIMMDVLKNSYVSRIENSIFCSSSR